MSAIREGRYGDAIWARYHITRDVCGGVIEGSDKIVLEMIQEDALGYKLSDPKVYAEALSLCTNTSSTDRHPEVIEIILRIGNQDTTALQAQLEAERRAELLAEI